MKMKLLALILAFSVLGVGTSLAGGTIWVGLYLAEDAPPPPGAVLAPGGLHESLRAVFGYRHYELLKFEEIELSHEWQQWAIPRKDFYIRVEPLHHEPGEPWLIYYEIYKDGFIMAKGRYEPHPEAPLFIRGPEFQQGRLIFVLDAR